MYFQIIIIKSLDRYIGEDLMDHIVVVCFKFPDALLGFPIYHGLLKTG